MPYWLESDTFADDPAWQVLAAGNLDRLDALQAAYARLKSKASHLLTDGYLTEQTALQYCRGRRPLLELLCTPVLERAPMVHRRGDECDCLGDTWIDGFDYRVHAFLRRNPSRAEYNRNRAQKADLRDARLKSMVYTRDGGSCRYCRSGPLSPKAGRSRDRRKALSYDHVDPDQPAGPDGAGLVVACARCNEHKGRRTPDEADMRLLPVPGDAERAAWHARGLALYDPEDHAPITDESPTKQQHDADPVSDPITDPDGDPEADRNDNTTPPVSAQTTDHQPEQPPAWSAKGDGQGRVGSPDPGPPSPPRRYVQQARPAGAPDIYHRRSRASPPPLPEYVWPPGAVPADRAPPEEEP